MAKKQRKQKHTILIYCEGKHEYLFVGYLKKTFVNSEKYIELVEGQGGAPSRMIGKTARNPAEYDKRYVLLDLDQRKNEDKKQHEETAKNQGITLIWSDPCLEGLFLQILNGHSQMPDSKKYKNYFRKNYNSGQRKYDSINWKDLFPKEKLVSKKEEIGTLKQLIEIINNIGDGLV